MAIRQTIAAAIFTFSLLIGSENGVITSKWTDINDKERIVVTKIYDESSIRKHLDDLRRMQKKYPIG